MDRAIAATCHTFLTGHGIRPVREQLMALAESPYAEPAQDTYGAGGAVALLEERMRALTGRAAARFVTKGMIAQMAALRVWTMRTGRQTVAVHRLSHLDYDEEGAVEALHPIRFQRVGDAALPFTVEDLQALGELPGAVSVELPLRRAGYRLTPYADLEAIADWCWANKVPLHIDGARAYGAAVAYGRPLSEIAAMGSSIYLSFYKELGGLAGCVLAGDEDFLAECAPWITRQAGAIYREFPLAIAALDGLDAHLGRLGEYAERARAIAAAINTVDGAYTGPEVPHTGGFQIFLEVDADRADPALEALTRETGIWISPGFYRSNREGHCCFDVEIGAASAALEPEAWADHIGKLIERARRAAPQQTSIG